MMHTPIRKTLAAVAVSGLLVGGSAGMASADDTTRENSEQRQQVEDNLTFGDFLADAFHAADSGNGNGSGNSLGNGNALGNVSGNETGNGSANGNGSGNGSGNSTDVSPDVTVDPEVDPDVDVSPEDNSTEDNSTHHQKRDRTNHDEDEGLLGGLL